MNALDFLSSLKNNLAFNPTSDQENAMESFTHFISDPDNRILYLLRGYAGTGKTSLISAISKTLPLYKLKCVLLAPTGKAAKVISNYSGMPAQTIHRKIYQTDENGESFLRFSLSQNSHQNTLFIVDEASMIGGEIQGEVFSNNLLDDLLAYVFSGENCRLMFSGDIAQLPPVGSSLSPALHAGFLKNKYPVQLIESDLKTVVRQSEESGILLNATAIRLQLMNKAIHMPIIEAGKDIELIEGIDLEEALSNAYNKYGFEDTLIICRSNKRANAYNQSVRQRIKWQENEIAAGDLIMAVKNNYYWLSKKNKNEFIANGETLLIKKVLNNRELYGFRFGEIIASFPDRPDIKDIEIQVLLDTLYSETPSLSNEKQKALTESIYSEWQDSNQGTLKKYLSNHSYYNALQIKFNYAVTCHKSQGGQWPCVFIDTGYLTKEMINEDLLRWYYTAITRATEKVFFVNYPKDLH